MTDYITLTIAGTPGPKGSVSAFCVRCAKKRLPSAVVIKEQSEVGAAFRKVIARRMRGLLAEPYRGAVEVFCIVYIEQRMQVRAGVPTGKPVPSEDTPRPIHHGSGDIEKHARNLHDAMQDAGVLADDCTVTDLMIRKRWADADHPAGIHVEFFLVDGPA